MRSCPQWDPYNVTEDADLGFRIARAGLRTITIASTTWEEAPVELGNWLKQRTRWLKGWMQTYLVHTRQPLRLLRELGLWRSLGLNILMGGILLSVLVHPFCYLLLGAALVSGHALEAGATSWEAWLWWVAAFNLAAGYATSMMVAAVAVARRGLLTLALHVVFMPVYWLLISVAGYRALIQLVRAPHVWEKTKHGASPASLGGVPDMIDWTALARYRGKLGDCLRQRP
jgi:glycosyltransferase XagB